MSIEPKYQIETISLSEYMMHRDERLKASKVIERSSFAVAFLVQGALIRFGTLSPMVTGELDYTRADRLDLNLYFRDNRGRQTDRPFPGFIDHMDSLWYPSESMVYENPDPGLMGPVTEGYLLHHEDPLETTKKTLKAEEVKFNLEIAIRGILSAN